MIDQDKFIDWCEMRFDGVKVNGSEVHVNSPYDPDQNDSKHKLSCNCSGETKSGRRESGVFHCWISGKKGTLVKLIMDTDHCSPEEAKEILGLDDNMSDIEDQLEEFFGSKKSEPIVIAPDKKILKFPEGTNLITNLKPWNKLRVAAESYLHGRKIPTDDLWVCFQGEYRERIIIPYRDESGNLVYYNGRYIGPSLKAPKYLGPPKDIGVGKGDVVYMPKWVEAGTLLHITEGEFDAMILSMCGLPSCAVGGSHLTDYQRKVLKRYKIKLCGDIDKPGAGAVFKTGMLMLEEGFKDISFVRPPKGYKDWNEMYMSFGNQIADWVNSKTKNFDLISAEQLFVGNL